ncbi:hypothetical protein OTB19_41275, partial [Streptomyces sp. H27-H5]|nr:hypothetical protein [Streptomyces sp. H27-G5]MCY0963225.1 hypothetical protein [Streptomyces sp. H27-H5]
LGPDHRDSRPVRSSLNHRHHHGQIRPEPEHTHQDSPNLTTPARLFQRLRTDKPVDVVQAEAGLGRPVGKPTGAPTAAPTFTGTTAAAATCR